MEIGKGSYCNGPLFWIVFVDRCLLKFYSLHDFPKFRASKIEQTRNVLPLSEIGFPASDNQQ